MRYLSHMPGDWLRVTKTKTMNDIRMPLEKFATAGDATFTVRSGKTGRHFTFRVRQPDEASPHFVSVLTGSDNNDSFTYLGTIFTGGEYRHGRRSSIGADAPSAIAFSWIWNHRRAVPSCVSVHHEGKCCRCGRKLTTPESTERGIGPECASKVGL